MTDSLPPMRHRLIITADDFGYSSERDTGILECFNGGAVTTASLLINGAAAKQACADAKKCGMPVGLHLNLTEGYPVSNKDNTSLVDADGLMLGKHGFRHALSQGKIDMIDVKREMLAQIEAFKSTMGGKPTHIDGHQHVHVLPGIVDVFAKTLVEAGIHRTRLPIQAMLDRCVWISTRQMDFFQEIQEQAQQAEKVFQKCAIKYPSGFLGTSTMGEHMTINNLKSALLSAKNKHHGNISSPLTFELMTHGNSTSPLTFELMTHPGYRSIPGSGGCGNGADNFSQSKEREHEMSVLKSNEWKQVLGDQNIQLCSYLDLK